MNMGWNTGYTIMEATVIGAYDLGKLDKDLLAVLLKPYAGSDIDRGGSCDLVTKKGKLTVEEVVIKIGGGMLPKRPSGPKEYSKMTEEQRIAAEAYGEDLHDAFRKVTKRFGW